MILERESYVSPTKVRVELHVRRVRVGKESDCRLQKSSTNTRNRCFRVGVRKNSGEEGT